MKQYKKSLTIIYVLVAIGLVSWWTYAQFFKHANVNQSTQASNNSLDSKIALYEDKLITQPDNVQTEIALASAYLQKVRETADTSYYAKVESLANDVVARDDKNADAYALLGGVALGKHNFSEALKFGQKSSELNPYKALYYGIIADAQTELGQNDAAVATLQKMVDTRPDYSSYSRIAYARELNGDIDGAKKAIEIAVEAGASFPENIAWGFVEYGKLALRNDLDESSRQFNLALETVPNYAPAYEGLGRVAFARGDNSKAVEYFEKAFKELPIAQYAIALGEVYKTQDESAKADQYYALVKVAFDNSEKSGVNTDMERALFLAEHDLDLPLAKRLAEQSYKIRPSIYGADTLAWSLYKNGDLIGAQKYITEALRLGEHDPLIVFHAAMIARKNGNEAQAQRYLDRVKAIHPYFSIIHSKEL